MNRIRLGLEIPTFPGVTDTHIESPCYEEFDYSITERVALLSEDLGYDSLWTADHLIFGRHGETAECWTLLSALASVTKRIRLGPLVFCDAHRNPALVAKMVATLDNISHGRINYGVGAGWRKTEQLRYGLPWLDSSIGRIKRMEEGIEIVRRMWTEDSATFDGKYYRISEAVCNPKPVQKPHPPIWIAGHGPVMLKTVARYANAWNWFLTTAEEHEALLWKLRKSCEDIGRNFNEIEISWQGRILIAKNDQSVKEKIAEIHRFSPRYPLSTQTPVMEVPSYESVQREALGSNREVLDFRAHGLVGTPDQVRAQMQKYIEIGVKHFILTFIDYPSTDGIQLFAEEVLRSLR